MTAQTSAHVNSITLQLTLQQRGQLPLPLPLQATSGGVTRAALNDAAPQTLGSASNNDEPLRDPLIGVLLQQVEGLMKERRALLLDSDALRRENDQLRELVGYLTGEAEASPGDTEDGARVQERRPSHGESALEGVQGLEAVPNEELGGTGDHAAATDGRQTRAENGEGRPGQGELLESAHELQAVPSSRQRSGGARERWLGQGDRANMPQALPEEEQGGTGQLEALLGGRIGVALKPRSELCEDHGHSNEAGVRGGYG